MAKTLVIVESPAKAKTIEKYLGSGYKVLASFGHVRDLPERKLGVDVKKDFEPEYVVPTKAKKVLSSLKGAVDKAENLYLATDFDREGEAIAWHVSECLKSGTKKKNVKRITFHEITKGAIEEAVKNPRELDMDLVDAQQARRILDRLVGYKLSPFLWKKVFKGLSAGRVQSVAVRLVVEREREIEKFEIKEYWTVEAFFRKPGGKVEFKAILTKVDGKLFKDVDKKDKADELVKDIKTGKYRILSVDKVAKKRSPAPPFTTSTLQQEAYRKLRYSAKQTMTIAQHLYEGVDVGKESVGLITYMRTDSFSLAGSAVSEARRAIEKEFGPKYVPKQGRIYKTKSKGAQEAHEAIRPTSFSRTPKQVKKYVDNNHYRLYKLIWERAMACQMVDAEIEDTIVEIGSEGSKKTYNFTSKGSIVTFSGFLKVYEEDKDEVVEEDFAILPDLKAKDMVNLVDVSGKQHFTQPPARYTEASLVKELEKRGIGRPSTYAPIMSTIVDRGYVQKLEGKFHPQEVGFIVTDLLTEHFKEIVDYKFTAKMEEELDDIAEGKLRWQPVIHEFYDPFEKNLENKLETVEKMSADEETEKNCPKCGKNLVIKLGRYGRFYACSGFPECDFTKPIAENEKGEELTEEEVKELTEEKCPKCGAHLMIRQGRFGQFLGCSNYPKCDFTKQMAAGEAVKCPNCKNGELVMKRTRRGKPFWGCSNYPKCKTAFWTEPVEKKCPECGGLMTKSGKDMVKCTKCEHEEAEVV